MNELIGKSLDRYRLDTLLAEGGMGAIFKAYDVTLQRDVALKIMHPHFARMPDFQERFLQEARSAARLNHPNIVRVYDFGEALTHLYIVMEFIPGQNLRKILQDLRAEGKWIVLPEALQIVREISAGLHRAHQAGVLHRDIKPENIMLKPEPGESLPYRPVITDLGLAKLAGGAGITQVGTSLGTPAYMSPEQTVGDKTDARSDVYSLGILLFEMSVGQLPFPVRNISDAIRYHTKEQPPAPRSLRPDMPMSLERTILTALQKQPDRRFPSAEALARALAHTLNEMGQGTPPPSVLAGLIPTPQQASTQQQPAPTQLAPSLGTPPTLEQDRIAVTTHDRQTHRVALTASGLAIGRSSENDLVLDHPTVSRKHARIEYDGTNYTVVDLRSTNGTFLGDVKLLPATPSVWSPDKTLRIGENWLKLELVQKAKAGADVTQELGVPDETKVLEGVSERAPATDRIAMFLDSDTFSVEPGSQTSVAVTVLNQGPVVDHYAASVQGIPAVWVKLPDAPLRLLTGQQGDIQISIQPPRSPESRAGLRPIKIRITSQDSPNTYVEAPASLTVGAFHELSMELRPRKQTGLSRGTFQAHLTNSSNTDLAAQLEATDPEYACEYRFEPPSITLAAGQARAVQLHVTSRTAPPLEGSRTYTFTVTARVPQVPELSAQAFGEWVQTPPRLELAIHPQRLSSAGEATYSLQATNAGTTDLPVSLSASDPERGCLYYFSPAEAVIPAGQVRMIQLIVRSRAPLTSGTPKVFAFTVNASPTGMPELTRHVTAEYEQVAPGFDLAIRPAKASSVSEAVFSVQLTNASTVDLTIGLAGRDPEEGCQFVFSPPQVHVPPGQQRALQLSVRPKTPLQGESPRSYPFTVTASPLGSPMLERQIQGEYVQLVPNFDLAIRPAKHSSAREGLFDIHLYNQSDAQLVMQLAAADAEQLCEYDFDRNSLPVPAGRTDVVKLVVRSKAHLRGDEPRTHSFAVTARPAESPVHRKQALAEWEQLPKRRLALGFLVPLLLTVIGWLVAYVLGVMVASIPIESYGIYDVYELEFALPWAIFGLVAGAVGGLVTGLALLLAEPKLGIGRVFAVMFGWMLCWTAIHAALPFVIDGLGIGEPFMSQAPAVNEVGFWAAFGAIGGLLGGLLMGRTVKRAQPAARSWLIALIWAVAFGAGEVVMAQIENLWRLVDQIASLRISDHPELLTLFALVGLIAGIIGAALTFWHVLRARSSQ